MITTKWNSMEKIQEYESDEALFETHYKKWQKTITIPRNRVNLLLRRIVLDVDLLLNN